MIIWFVKNTEVLLETQKSCLSKRRLFCCLYGKKFNQSCLIFKKKRSKLCLYQPQNTNMGLIQSFWGSKVHIIGTVKLILFHAGL